MVMGLLDRFRKSPQIRPPRLEGRLAMNDRVEMRLPRDHTMHAVSMTDVSAGGACISTPLQLAKNQDLTLKIRTGPGEDIPVVGRVLSVRKKPDRLHVNY